MLKAAVNEAEKAKNIQTGFVVTSFKSFKTELLSQSMPGGQGLIGSRIPRRIKQGGMLSPFPTPGSFTVAVNST